MKKLRILLSVVAVVFSVAVAFGAKMATLDDAWYAQHPTTGAPTVQLSGEPECMVVTPQIYCAARFNIQNGNPVGSPIAGSQKFGQRLSE